jgi:hypothetical protein
VSDQITVARSQQFNAVVKHLLQQKGSLLRSKVTEGSYTGKQAVAVNQIGLVAAQKKNARHAELPIVSTPHARRWVSPSRYEFRDFFDSADRLRMLFDPKSDYAEAFAMALGRAMDDEIIAAAFAASKVGEEGDDTEAFDTTNFQIVAGGVGMTVAKLRLAKRKFRAAQVPQDEPLFCSITAAQHDNLLTETQATNLDYTDKPVLVDGRITRFMGFNFVDIERLGVDGSAARRCIAWARSGLHLGVWEDVRTPIDWLPERQAWQVAGVGDFGATRTEQGKVIEILCVES